jgi:vacuolar protein sorting-associated protein 29
LATSTYLTERSTFPPRYVSLEIHSRHASRQSAYRVPFFPNLQFKKLLTPGKIAQTLCLGNLTDRSTYEYLRSITPDLKMVKGRMDVEATSLPLTQVVTHGAGLRIGFLEGFTLVSDEPDILLAEANKLDVDVLCWGGTHKFECFEYMDKFFINPGSATGAFTTDWAGSEEVVPSFCLMDVSGVSSFHSSVGRNY